MRRKLDQLRASVVFRRDIWTYVIVTMVTVVIWVWAAAETRDTETYNARIHFTTPDAEQWKITPGQTAVTINAEGSQLALQRVYDLLRTPLRVELTASQGRRTIDLVDRLRTHSAVEATGVRILSTEPASIELDIDEMRQYSARVVPRLLGVQVVGDIEVEPSEVQIVMPVALRQQLPSDLTVEAFVDRGRLEPLETEVPHTLTVRLRPPEGAPPNAVIEIRPETARVTFRLRSRIRELDLDSVRVQLAGPPEDSKEYIVEVENAVLRNVTIQAESDLIRLIESEEATVVAMLHLSSREKEQGIESKPISYFLALVPDGEGRTIGRMVQATVNDSPEPPLVRFNVTRKELP